MRSLRAVIALCTPSRTDGTRAATQIPRARPLPLSGASSPRMVVRLQTWAYSGYVSTAPKYCCGTAHQLPPLLFEIACCAKDFASIPQNGADGVKRSPAEKALFDRGLAAMGSFYASICGTAVVQLKNVPPGSTHYDREGGGPYSGWCTFEQGVSIMAATHLAAAEKHAADAGSALPPRLMNAQASRPKLTDISGGVACPREPAASAEKLLAETVHAIEGATFVGKGDKTVVQQMLAEVRANCPSLQHACAVCQILCA